MNFESSCNLGLAVGASADTRLQATSGQAPAFIQVVQRHLSALTVSAIIVSDLPFQLGIPLPYNAKHVHAGGSFPPWLCMAGQSVE